MGDLIQLIRKREIDALRAAVAADRAAAQYARVRDLTRSEKLAELLKRER